MLLRFFILYLPFLIEGGRVYKAIPPLFMIKNGNKKKYFTENSDMVEFNQAEFVKKYKVETKNGELKGRQLKEFFIINADYKYERDVCAANHALSPKILELVLMSHLAGKSSKALEKEFKSYYRFVNMRSDHGIDIVEISDDQLYTVYFTDDFINDCKDAIKAIRNNDHTIFKLNGSNASLYDIMNAYESISPSNVSRFKGLGEMDADELGDSTILPENRTLIRYTVESVKEEIKTIRELESNKKKLLDLAGDINRKDLIGL